MAQGRMERRWSFVAVEGAVGGWTAYAANEQSGDRDLYIKAWGDKLPHSVAAAVFPRWDRELAWRR